MAPTAIHPTPRPTTFLAGMLRDPYHLAVLKKKSTFNCSRLFINLLFQSKMCREANGRSPCLCLGGFDLSSIKLLKDKRFGKKATQVSGDRGEGRRSWASHLAGPAQLLLALPRPGCPAHPWAEGQTPCPRHSCPHHRCLLGDTVPGSGNTPPFWFFQEGVGRREQKQLVRAMPGTYTSV